jgi:hypothetical protein
MSDYSSEFWIGSAALFVAIVGLVALFVVEHERRPKLLLLVGPFADSPRDPRFRVLHVKVTSKRKLVASEIAINCRGTATFRDLHTGQLLVSEMGCKWGTKPEPVRLLASSPDHFVQYVDDALLEEAYAEDIAAGGNRPLTVAIKFASEREFYGFGPESYRHNLKNPDYRMDSASCTVEVTVTADNTGPVSASFVLENGGTHLTDFYLGSA